MLWYTMSAAMAAPALALALAHGPLLATRLPEPADGVALGKLEYKQLGTPIRIAWLVAVALGAQLATGATVMWPAWLVYGSSVAALTWVDACTTWLPVTLNWLVTGELALACGLWCVFTGDALLALRMAGGAVASLGFWWLFWRISRGALGFGDVRLAPLAGAMAATLGVAGWFAALLASAVLGVVWGLTIGRLHPAPGTKHGFAYGPALWAGPYLGLLWVALFPA